MSNKTQLQTNNTKIDELTSLAATMKDKAAALPDAGSGGSVETCTVEIVCQDGAYLTDVATNIVLDGVITPYFFAFFESVNNEKITSLTIENVLCGSSLLVGIGGISIIGASLNNMTPNGLESAGNGSRASIRMVTTPTEAGTTGTMTIYNND